MTTTDNPPTDIIIPGDQLPTPQKDEFSVTECLHLLASLIDHELLMDETPEHTKPDLRCLRAIVSAITKQWPFMQENDMTNIAATKSRCTNAMRELVRELMTIYQDTSEGKYHKTRAMNHHDSGIE